MKTIILWGGALGFGLAGAAGLAAERPLDLVIRDAAIACLAGAWLFRWWWMQLERALTDSIEIRRQEAAKAAEAEDSQNETPTHAGDALSARRSPANPAMARANPAAPPASRL